MFKHLSILVGCCAVLLAGCDPSGPIIIQPDETTDQIDFSLLTSQKPDTTVVLEYTYDLTGLTPQDEKTYPATILVNAVRTDLGEQRVRYSYSRLLVTDRRDTIPISGRFGYYAAHPALDIGQAKVNAMAFERSESIVQIRSLTLLPVRTGIFYRLINEGNETGKPFVFVPASTYLVESDGRATIGSFSHTIQSPDELTLLEPKPLSLVLRDESLVLKWQGKTGSEITVIISTYDQTQGKPLQPLMVMSAKPRAKMLVIPAKIMRLIPSSPSGRLMFTIVSSNRKEVHIPGYEDKVLMQSSSINNVAFIVY
jgi:hypothetical protein